MSAHTTASREPLLNKAKVTATINGLVSLLVTLGLVPATLGKELDGTAEAVIAAVGLLLTTVPHIMQAISARKDVTPMTDPRNNDGVKLEPVAPVDPTPGVLAAPPVDPAAALAEAEAIAPTADPLNMHTDRISPPTEPSAGDPTTSGA